MTAVTIAIIAVVVSAFAMIPDGPAGMITAESIAATVTVSAAGVIGTAVTRVTTACTATMTTANAATAVTTTSVTVTATASVTAAATILRKGGVHDRQVSRQ